MEADALAAAEVAVIAGTPFDAGLGADLLRAAGVPARPCPMAASPDEQDALQYLSPDALGIAFTERLLDLGAQGSTLAMLFCNSLSAVLDHDEVAAVSPVRLVSPSTVYRELADRFRTALVVTGNGQAIVGFERAFAQASAGHRVLGVSDPALVRAIEQGDPARAFAASALPSTLRLAGRLGLDAVVLACTHFTTVLPYATAACTLPVIDVGSRLVALTRRAAAAPAPLAGSR
jgi:glutamate racemase